MLIPGEKCRHFIPGKKFQGKNVDIFSPRIENTEYGKIRAPLGAPYNTRPSRAPIFRFIFVGNFLILFFSVEINKISEKARLLFEHR